MSPFEMRKRKKRKIILYTTYGWVGKVQIYSNTLVQSSRFVCKGGYCMEDVSGKPWKFTVDPHIPINIEAQHQPATS